MFLTRSKRAQLSLKTSIVLLISLLYPIFVSTPVAKAAYGGACASGTVTQTTDTATGAQVEIFNAPASGNANCWFQVPDGVVAVDYLVVAGGGGGASGGGGGGGVITNREVRLSNNSVLANRRSGLAVSSGDSITVTVGRGGDYQSGGSQTTARTGVTTKGGDSVFGSITAFGGGGGGTAAGAGESGGSNGGAAFDNNNGTQNAISTSAVTGANTFGNQGGASGGGSYSAGGGGGGAGAVGGAARAIPFHGSFATPTTLSSSSNPSCSNATGNSCYTLGGGGDGGQGVLVDIRSTGTFDNTQIYGCGGGGGVNNNSNDTVTGTISTAGNAKLQSAATVLNFGTGTYSGAGAAGCSTAGRGSNFANAGANINTARFNGTSGQSGFGGGGGGTDPESTLAGAGGSGIVIISYLVNNSNCPNNGSNTSATRPLACNFTISVTAGGATVSVDARGNPYSYSDTSTTRALITVQVDATNLPIDTTTSANIFRISAPSTTNPLRGGTYPVLYSLNTTTTDTSFAYMNVNVRDPAQHTPARVGIDPRTKVLSIPRFVFGTVNAVLLCITPRTSNATGYQNTPTVSMSAVASNASLTTLSGGAIRLQGTNDSITANASNFRITASGNERLLPGSAERIFDVNVSNTATGGNGSCSGGTASTITVYKIGVSQTTRKTINPLGNGKQ